VKQNADPCVRIHSLVFRSSRSITLLFFVINLADPPNRRMAGIVLVGDLCRLRAYGVSPFDDSFVARNGKPLGRVNCQFLRGSIADC
jgi:hypothetical protein